MKLSLYEISMAIKGQLFGDPEKEIIDFHIDSRKYISPSGSIFFALRGERNDGHKYIDDLISRGISSFIVETLPQEIKEGINFIKVQSCMVSMHLLASYIRSSYHNPVIAITGSNGKTILKEWLFQCLSLKYKIYRSPESYNSQVGVPLSLFMLDQESDMAIIEAGISRPGEMQKLKELIQPEIGIITNIGEAHQENFRDKNEKLLEKLLLFRNSRKIIYCSDYEEITLALKQFPESIEKISWGDNDESDYSIKLIQEEGKSILKFSRPVDFSFKLDSHDHASAENACHLVVILFEFGFKEKQIQSLLHQLEPVAMRMEIIKGTGASTIINDSYNSDLVSVENALDYLSAQDQHKKKTIILSDILQSGKSPAEIMKSLSSLVKKRHIDTFIGIGQDFFSQKSNLPADWFIYQTTDDFISDIRSHNFLNEAILLKGSRKFEFERISSLLQEKTHRTTLDINLNALIENYRFYRSLLSPKTKVMAMVKAFSYGSGGYEVASSLQYNKVDYLAVAYADEGVELRKNGISIPIMVMNPEQQDFNFLVKYNMEPEIYSLRILREFKSFLKRNAIRSWPVHIKLDTGMHRLGFELKDIDELLSELNDGSLRIVSVFSHLAAADDKKYDEFTRDQIASFNTACDKINKQGPSDFFRHILNTTGIERFPEAEFEMVRLGIGLYGISEKYAKSLKEISTFRTIITQIKELDKSESIGYGRAGRLNKKSRIGTLPVGYADGIPRSLGNGKGKFMVNGRLVPVIGNVCMDMIMVDLTATNAVEGDEVIIFGKGLSVKNMADAIGTISYEVLTGISQRVKRVYYIE